MSGDSRVRANSKRRREEREGNESQKFPCKFHDTWLIHMSKADGVNRPMPDASCKKYVEITDLKTRRDCNAAPDAVTQITAG